ncbi:MAG: hypothetical protein PF439_04025 [Helicobacteraceae bacterium]|jgi:hypothetical protein|nr:hypothetical protein [Helicobacteraceae bacterium]
MLKQKSLFIGTLGIVFSILTGCSQSDGYSTSKNEAVEVIHGYTLPTEPDPTINNSTLLGIDSNDNGVRDDVEIWILKKYKDKHPIYTEIAMQSARASKKVLENPERAKEFHDYVNSAYFCASYYRVCDNNSTIKIDSLILDENFRIEVFNTDEREKAYWKYDSVLSGDSYTIPWCSERQQLCDFNTTKFE